MQGEYEAIAWAATIFVVMTVAVVVDFISLRLVKRSLINSMEKFGGKKSKERNSITEKLYYRYHEDGWILFVYLSLPMLFFEIIYFWITFAGFFSGQIIHWEFWTFPGEFVPLIWGIFGVIGISRRALNYRHELKIYVRDRKEIWKSGDY